MSLFNRTILECKLIQGGDVSYLFQNLIELY